MSIQRNSCTTACCSTMTSITRNFKWLTIAGELYLHLGNRAWLEFQDGGDGYFAVDRVVFSPDSKPPQDPQPKFELEDFAELVQGTACQAYDHELGVEA